MTRTLTLPRARRPLISPTLTGYIARQFTVMWFSFFVGIGAIIFLATLVDLLDRMSNKEGVSLAIIAKLAFLKLPYLSLEVLPFTVLFASLATFWRLTRSHELVVTRAAGVSVWQFLLPVLLVAVTLGGLAMTLVNPVASAMLSRFEKIESSYSKSRQNILTVSQNGLWLRQVEGDGLIVIHAGRSSRDVADLVDVVVFRFGPNDVFLSRLDAKNGRLEDGKWILSDAWLSVAGEPPDFREQVEIPTDLTSDKIQESFAKPETISFWALPTFVELLEQSGFSALRHRLQFNRLLATPLLLAAMVLIAATFSLRPQRRGKVAIIILSGAITGFLLYFLSSFVFALGLSGKIPVILAGWAPAGASMLLGIAMLFHLEDG